MRAAIAERATLVGKFALPLDKCGIIVPLVRVAYALAADIDNTIRTPISYTMISPKLACAYLKTRGVSLFPEDLSQQYFPASCGPTTA